ncbi:hypothetical protein PGTUg99_007554 [Puccinia graminis f. sp. tritici]|uniref:Uncharacterized protein n=1 Tax=Puccinia graminis f. sp. tritici TaxID=56615 RepID=A0A5B0S329_PUCGR|nr:hypothetical protein PGTUg99_007554 [Puccinia graminis f. sp. tritici]
MAFQSRLKMAVAALTRRLIVLVDDSDREEADQLYECGNEPVEPTGRREWRYSATHSKIQVWSFHSVHSSCYFILAVNGGGRVMGGFEWSFRKYHLSWREEDPKSLYQDLRLGGCSAPAAATTTQQTSAQPKSTARYNRLTLHDRFTAPSVYNPSSTKFIAPARDRHRRDGYLWLIGRSIGCTVAGIIVYVHPRNLRTLPSE